MSITLNTVAFTRDRPLSNNKLAYTSGSNTFSITDQVSLGSYAPKSKTIGEGVARSEFKRTKTLTLSDSSVKEAIIKVEMSVPVGAVASDVTALLDDVGDFLISAGATSLAVSHVIDQ